MENSNKTICIIIPSYNRITYLKKLLHQIDNQQKEDFSVIVIVVNDGSDDGTKEMIQTDFPRTFIVNGNDWWYTKSINKGIEEAQKHNPDYFLLLNDDIEIDNNYVLSIYNSIKEFDRPTIVGSLSVTLNKPHRVTFSGVYNIKWWRFKQYHYHRYLEKVNLEKLKGVWRSELLPGRGMMIDSRILRKIGVFEPLLIQYASDDEYCYRAIRNGFDVFVAKQAIVYSHHNLTGDGTPQLRQSFQHFFLSIFNKYSRNYWKKHFFIVWNYGHKILFPLTIFIIYLGVFYSYLKNIKTRNEIASSN